MPPVVREQCSKQPTAETPGGETPTPEIAPESVNKKINIILEGQDDSLINEIDLEKGSRSLGEIEKQLGKLID